MYQPFMKRTICLDEWTREIIHWHFHPDTGSPFWLKQAERLEIDPLKDVKTYDDLKKFALFDENELKRVSAEELIPKGYMGREGLICRVFETGGTLGEAKRIIDCTYRNHIVRWLSFSLDINGFPREGNWLHLGPAGPHVIGYTTGMLAHIRKGLCYYIDIDTRWIRLCVKRCHQELMDEYMDHILSQATAIMDTQRISFLFTTPQLLQRLGEKVHIGKKYRLKGIVCGGTHVSPDLHRLLREEIVPGIPLCFVYGNTLMGVAPQEPFDEKEGWDIKYYGFFPYFIIKVVNPENPFQEVGYGETGRIMITALNRDYFIPNLLERDEGVRIAGNELYPWDGVANVKPYRELEEQIIEGVY